ncbi:MAG TPA: invasion associated locus B family protein [Alphaproteobacteria bacterium]|nr:invasion associated locus B family protein [Alphaproteobacteria bacterium]
MNRITPLLLCLALTLPAVAAHAEDGLGRFGAWRSFRLMENGKHVCYMIAHPLEAASMKVEKITKTKKGTKKTVSTVPREAYIMLTFRPAEGTAPVFNYNAGTVLKEGEARLVAGKDDFSLFTTQDGAWARTPALDQSIAKTLRKGGKLEITATAAKGAALRDRFDIKGAEDAYRKIATACGIP